MGRYYLIKMSLIYDQICGIITMMAAIFTVTWMQKNNELLAMLAAGISTQRIIRPVLISALVVSSLAVVNQELIMPRLAEELQTPPDDDGTQKVKVYTPAGRQRRPDLGRRRRPGDADDHQVLGDHPRPGRRGADRDLGEGGPLHPRGRRPYPLRGGWILSGRQVPHRPAVEGPSQPPPRGSSARSPTPRTTPRRRQVRRQTGHQGVLPQDRPDLRHRDPERHWYQFAPTADLIRALSDPTNYGERGDIQVFLHARLIRPLLGFNLMLLSLPLVLGGAGRNMFINLGMSLGTSGLFYSVNFMCQYLGAHEVLPPELAAWAPLIVFGTIAVARWDTIRT